MKKTIPALIAVLAFFGCKKDSGSPELTIFDKVLGTYVVYDTVIASYYDEENYVVTRDSSSFIPSSYEVSLVKNNDTTIDIVKDGRAIGNFVFTLMTDNGETLSIDRTYDTDSKRTILILDYTHKSYLEEYSNKYDNHFDDGGGNLINHYWYRSVRHGAFKHK